MDPMQLLSSEKDADIHHNEKSQKNIFSQISFANTTNPNAMQNTFLEFLQKGKFANVQKPQLPQHTLPTNENNNADAQNFPFDNNEQAGNLQ